MDKLSKKAVLFLAQGFGSGWAPFAPGTWGSLLGVGWFAVLLSLQSMTLFIVLQLASFLLSVWACGRAETILGKTDPGSVVLDEIVAIPLCFTAPILWSYLRTGVMPEMSSYFGPDTWWIALAGFILFRVFDIAKPWPVGASQKLPGGLGITIDDLLAGVYVSLCLWVIVNIIL